MSTKISKDTYNDPTWDVSKFTKPNGAFGHNENQQLIFIPNKLPPPMFYDAEFVMLLAKAERKVGELKGKGSELENPHVLIRAYLKREAVLSSKIEGTLASLEDLNKHEAVGNIGKSDVDNLGLLEVINYVYALEESLELVSNPDQKIDLDILKKAHGRLMKGVRGQDKNPGEFRQQQNWIVKTQGTKQQIIYTPPSPEIILELLHDLEKFFQTNHEQLSTLIQCAIIHYQFEAIHPFLDGNGRIGRLLLPIILYKKGILPEPLLYLSAYFDKHQEEYYNGLLDVSQKSKWRDWIKFFLRAFIEQADETIKNIQRLEDLKRKYKEMLRKKNTSSNVVLLMEHLFANPYITIPKAKDFLNVTYPSAKNAIMMLVDSGVLKQTDIVYSSKVFLAEEIEDTLNVD